MSNRVSQIAASMAAAALFGDGTRFPEEGPHDYAPKQKPKKASAKKRRRRAEISKRRKQNVQRQK